jgi:hypothetical protein
MPMTRHYKAITDHVPIDYLAHLNRIDVYFNWKARELVELFERRKLRELEGDGCQSLICQLKRRLTSFALECNALPLRTPQQLMATAQAIARNPQAFSSKTRENTIPRSLHGSMMLSQLLLARTSFCLQISNADGDRPCP